MKLVTFSATGVDQHVGALIDDDAVVADLTGAAGGDPSLASVQALIEAGPDGLVAARELVDDGQRHDAADTTLHAPVPKPAQIRDCLCFEEHLKAAFGVARKMMAAEAPDPEARLKELEEAGVLAIPDVYYQQPIYYKANRFACIGTGTDIQWPHYASLLDYELEFAAWIGRPGRDIPAEEAEEHIFGYSVFNDVSARDAQITEAPGQLGPAKSKDFDTANVLGPCIVTADEIDPGNLTMIARINGEEVSRGSSSTMTWTFPKVIAHVSASETLHAGEVLGSGTVGGGCGLERGTFLTPGDEIELEVVGIGVLRNRIVKEES